MSCLDDSMTRTRIETSGGFRLVEELTDPPQLAYREQGDVHVATLGSASKRVLTNSVPRHWLETGTLLCSGAQLVEFDPTANQSSVLTHLAPGGRIGAVSVSPGEESVAFVHEPAASKLRYVYLLDIGPGAPEPREIARTETPGPMAFCWTNRRPFFGVRSDQPRESIDCTTATCVVHREPWWRTDPFPEDMDCWVLARSGKSIAYVRDDRSVCLRDSADRTLVSLAEHPVDRSRSNRGSVAQCFWSRDERYLAVNLARWLKHSFGEDERQQFDDAARQIQRELDIPQVGGPAILHVPTRYRLLIDLELEEIWLDTGGWKSAVLR